MVVLLHPARAYGAVERYVTALARALGDECVLVHPGVEQFERLGVKTLPLARPTVPSLMKVLRGLRPRLAHVTDVWPQAVVAARLARVPRLLVTHHTPELPRGDNLAGRAWQRLGWALRPEVIYTSESDRARDGRRPSYVIPLGIDLERFAAARAAPAGEVSLVGTVGRLAPQKDQQTLLEAAALVPEARFVLVGDGELRLELERRAAELEIADRVTFTGAREDVPELLASFDVFAHPSLFEGFCLAVLEAQAAGVPVVATPVGGIPETVVDGETGLLVPTRDPAALAAAIRRLLEDREFAQRLADAARLSARRYSTERMVEETLKVYSSGRRANAISVSEPEA
jgi:glycosyltransferase involved in cell wall biosynthesis